MSGPTLNLVPTQVLQKPQGEVTKVVDLRFSLLHGECQGGRFILIEGGAIKCVWCNAILKSIRWNQE